MTPNDDTVAHAFGERLRLTREELRKQMDSRGLTEAAGWRILETLRTASGGVELLLRPFHLRFTAPEELYCVVTIREPGGDLSSLCGS